MKLKNKQKGFTLIELMMVISIMFILVAIFIPNFVKFVDRARNADSITNSQRFQRCLETYNLDSQETGNARGYPCTASEIINSKAWAEYTPRNVFYTGNSKTTEPYETGSLSIVKFSGSLTAGSCVILLYKSKVSYSTLLTSAISPFGDNKGCVTGSIVYYPFRPKDEDSNQDYPNGNNDLVGGYEIRIIDERGLTLPGYKLSSGEVLSF